MALTAKRQSSDIVQKAATRALNDLNRRANLAIRMIQRQMFGAPRHEDKEALAFAELLVIQLLNERGAHRKAIVEAEEKREKRAELTAEKSAEATAAATASIEAAYTTAINAMLAMGLSAARNQTLTAIIRALADSSIAAVTSSNVDAARAGANVALNKFVNVETDVVDKLTTQINRFTGAIDAEGARLGIRV